MQIIIPMAGSGKRFVDDGFSEIKPLIKIHGQPMIEYVINFFPGEEDFVFICSNEHFKNPKLKKTLSALKPTAKISGIDFVQKKGPVHGVLWAQKAISDTEPVIITYCDYGIFWDYEDFKKFARQTNADGIVVSYTGFHPHLLGPNFYAGVKTDIRGKILEIKEKFSYHSDKLKGWHSCGLYYFKSGALAKKYLAKHTLNAPHENGEHYISTVYNELIQDGLLCLNYPLKYFCQWGTPEDLAEYNIWVERAKEGYQPKNNAEKNIIAYWKKFISLKSNH